MTGFEQRILKLLAMVPAGRVTTYAELARAAGQPRAVRAVGNALHKNPDAPRVPCHRVVRSDGRLGGYAGGPDEKVKYLGQEGVVISKGKVADFSSVFFKF